MKLFRKITFHISQAQSDDYPHLANIHNQCFVSAWSEDELAATLAANGTNCFIANIHGRGNKGPKGFIIVRTLGGQSEVLTIAIDREYRQRGMGRALMEHSIRHLHGERVERVFLEVGERNRAALNLYESLKFKQISVRKAYYRHDPTRDAQGEAGSSNASRRDSNSGRANALVMQLELR